MGKLPEKLQSKLTERLGNNALRKLPSSAGLVDFSSNDYLGLAMNEGLTQIATGFLEGKRSVNGSSGSRLLTGNHGLYKELEDFLTQHHRAESALVFNSGYDANIGFFSSVPQRGDIVLYDELIHASIRDGIQMGHAKGYKFAHNNLDSLERKLRSLRVQLGSEGDVYVVTESVFSMDGDSPNLKVLANFCTEEGCFLVVDEAHATGVLGEGRDLICQLGLEHEVFARIITFGKAIGCHGAAILGPEKLKTYLVNFARSFIYTTALPPHTVATILASYQYIRDNGTELSERLLENITYFKKQVSLLDLEDCFIESNSAIQCALVPGNEKVKTIAAALQEEGFEVKPILSPTVKEREERLRFCLHAHNTKEEISRILHIVQRILGEKGILHN
ncbi:MAG: 8-amino-7-oxononanoate synthase [Flavobacteriaceae bacterium]|uniref:aminotransferase class I/II-fold pyridoxal phosphate-dependent enzyme n=1 Tax=Flagellimonas sp. SN16 TaxID=3415142 RepID=UPI003C3D061F|nr:8-amino-7-oxononanoate synthase [Flavobacteriaceae bacterium]